MDSYSVERQQNEQSRWIAESIKSQSGKQDEKIQEAQHSQWQGAHAHLVSILRMVDIDFNEASEKANAPLQQLSDDDLAYLIQVRVRILTKRPTGNPPESAITECKKSLAEAVEANKALTIRNRDLEDENRSLVGQVSTLEAHLHAVSQLDTRSSIATPTEKITPSAPNICPPDWNEKWKQMKSYEKTSAVIQIMGDTGLALRPGIVKVLAKRLSLSDTNRSLEESINSVISPDDDFIPPLVEEIDTGLVHGSSAGGNSPSVVKLTEQGKAAYTSITGKSPVPNEYEILFPRHSTPEHTILNIQAAEILTGEGYIIQGKAQAIQLQNGETYVPDLVVKSITTGEILFIEVECDVNKDHASRKNKWIKAHEASGGNIYIFCDNLNCQRAIQSELNLSLSGLAYSSSITNLCGLRQGKRSIKDGSIWLSQKTSRS
jgi:hypothetical protein